jgi:hypothetical protein
MDMTKFRTLLAAGSIGAAALALSAAPASAATVFIKSFVGGPFSSLNPLGTLPATKLAAGDTYDFTFDLVAPIVGESSTQAAAQVLSLSLGEPIQYQVYEGTPTTGSPEAGTLLATSAFGLSPVVTGNWGVGDYYVNILPSEITVGGEVVSGSFQNSAVPEPATWAMMLIGVGLIGGGLRLARRSDELAMPTA